MSHKPCPVCVGVEPVTIDRLLLLGRGPRFIAPKFGHVRRDVKRHRDTCLTGERRAKVEADLMRMVDDAGDGGVDT